MPQPIVRVAMPGPFYEGFDYTWPLGGHSPQRGLRVRAGFGRRECVGLVIATDVTPGVSESRLREIQEIIDATPLIDETLLDFILWAARYYHYPPGDAINTALPRWLREGRAAAPSHETYWRLTEAGAATKPDTLARRARRQAGLLTRLQARGELGAGHFPAGEGDWRGGLQRLVDRGLAETVTRPAYALIHGQGTASPPELNADQASAAHALSQQQGFSPILLDGVTGSGKTAVYLAAIQATLAQGHQALVIVPEIGLTPQLVDRFAERLDQAIVVLHSGLSDGERLGAWLAARDGEAGVVIGTRSAVFTPLARPGLMVIDEEHDVSLKQQEGFRYHSRDMAVARASRLAIPVALGSATPSLESLYNVRRGRYDHQRLPARATGAAMPTFRLLDIRSRHLRHGLSAPLIEQTREHLERGGQVLLFLNRRGYAPTMLCHECGWVAECQRCDTRYTYHQAARRLHCHHCNSARGVPTACPACASPDLRAVGVGTERLEELLAEEFPETALVRIDRDSTRRKGEFERRLERARNGEARLLLGTQMLAKGHHLPAVTLVGIIDADQGLFGADFRAPERLAQLIIQVAGRAGRAERPGEVAIQTHQPEHPLLQQLVQRGYPAFAADALAERQEAGLPPFSALALLRAEAVTAEPPEAFLAQAAELANARRTEGIHCLGPMPAPMPRRAGRYRAQLILQSAERQPLQRLLAHITPMLKGLDHARRVRWSLDVDPAEML
jgi:primosomal protein N' (replication factor Y)